MHKGAGWKAYVLLLTSIATTLVLSLSVSTMARYVTTADVPREGRVAAWNPRFSVQPDEDDQAATVFVTHFVATHNINRTTNVAVHASARNAYRVSGPSRRYFTIQNNSQVQAEITAATLRYLIGYEDDFDADSPIDFDFIAQNRIDSHLAIGGETDDGFNMVAPPLSQPIRRLRVFFDAVQVN